MSSELTIFIAKGGGTRFPKVYPDGTIQYIFFGPGLTTINDDELFDQMCSHPTIQNREACGEIVFYDGRKDGKESNLGLQLADVKVEGGKEEGIPVAELDTKSSKGTARSKYKKSKDTSGTKKKRSLEGRAHGENPIPANYDG